MLRGHMIQWPTTNSMAESAVGGSAVGLAGLFEYLAADQHAADFARPGPDLVKLGVAQQPPGRVVVDIAIAAEALDGVERDPGRALSGIENGAGGIARSLPSARISTRRPSAFKRTRSIPASPGSRAEGWTDLVNE